MGADYRSGLAGSLAVAIAIGSAAELANRAVAIGRATRRTRSFACDANACHPRMTLVRVGDAVAATDGVELLGAGGRERLAGAEAIAISRGFQAEFTAGAVRVTLASALARSATSDVYARLVRQAFVVIGHAIATANRVEYPSTGRWGGLTGPFAVAVARILRAILAFVADSVVPTRLVTLSGVVHVDAGRLRKAGIRVRDAIAATDGIKDSRAHHRCCQAGTESVAVALALAQYSPGGQSEFSALPLREDTYPGSVGVAAITIGDAVTAPDWVEDVWARDGGFCAHAGATAVSLGLVAEEAERTVRSGIARIGRWIVALAFIQDVDARRFGFAPMYPWS